LLGRLKKAKGRAVGLTVTIGAEAGAKEWLDLNTFEQKQVDPALIEECLESLRKIQTEGQVKLEARALHFPSGQDLLDWVEDTKTTLQPNEVKQ
jgi:hypothetical protein